MMVDYQLRLDHQVDYFLDIPNHHHLIHLSMLELIRHRIQ
jgi:hypothetical protein